MDANITLTNFNASSCLHLNFSFPFNPNNAQHVLEAKVIDSKVFILFPFLEQFYAPGSSLKKPGISQQCQGYVQAPEKECFSSAVLTLSPYPFSVRESQF